MFIIDKVLLLRCLWSERVNIKFECAIRLLVKRVLI